MDARQRAVVLAGLGALLGVSLGWHLVVWDSLKVGTWHWVIAAVLLGSAVVGVFYASYWHVKHPLPDERDLRLAVWVVSSALLFVGLGTLILYNGSETVVRQELWETVHLTATLGLSVGVLVGTTEARAISQSEAVARAQARADALAAEQERLNELNDLFRHYILNGAAIIKGYTDHLQLVVPEEERDVLQTIEDRADTMAMLVSYMRVLTRHTRDEPSSTTVSLQSILDSARTEVSRETGIPIDQTDSVPDVDVPDIMQDCLYLLLDGIATATEETGRVCIQSDEIGPDVTLRISASPATLPANVKEALFEPIGAGAGLEFYLAKKLCDETVDLTHEETDENRLSFVVRLRPVDSPRSAATEG